MGMLTGVGIPVFLWGRKGSFWKRKFFGGGKKGMRNTQVWRILERVFGKSEFALGRKGSFFGEWEFALGRNRGGLNFLFWY